MAFDGTLKFDTAIDKSGFEQGISSLGSLAKKGMAVVAGAVTAAAGAVAAIGGYAVKTGSSFESSMAQVIATMGITRDTIQDGANSYELLKNAAAEAGESTVFSASEAADALNYLALAGYDAKKASEALPAVLDLAAAGGLDLAYASDLATDAMAALGIEATSQNLTRFGDEMAKTASKANTSVSQLGEAILTVGGTAQSLAGGTTELNAALGALANRGIKGAEGGTHLRNMILSLTAPTDTAAASLEALGVSALDADGNMRPLNETFSDLNTALSGMSDGERSSVLSDIFNKTDLAAAQGLLAGCGAEFDELTAALSDCDGAMSDMAATMNDTLEGDMKSLQSKAEAFGNTVYEGLNAPLRELAQLGGDYISQLTAAFKEGGFEGFAESFGGVLAEALTTLSGYVPKIADMAVSLVNSLISGISEHAESIAEAGLTAAQSLISGIVSAAGGLVSLGKSLISSLLSGISEMLESGAVSDILGSAMDVVISLANGILELLPQLVRTLADSITEALPVLIPKLFELVYGIVETLTSSDLISALDEAMIPIVTALADGLFAAAPIVYEKLPKIIENLFSMLGDLWKNTAPVMLEQAKELLEHLKTGIAEVLPQLFSALKSMLHIGDIFGAFEDAGEWIYDRLSEAKNRALSGAQSIIEGISDWFRTLPERVGEHLGNALGTIAEWALEAPKKAREAASGFIANVQEFLQRLPQLAGELLGKALDRVVSWAAELKIKGQTAAKDLVDKVVNGIRELPGKMTEAGKNLVEGLWNGITSAGDWLKGKISDFGNGVISGFKDAFGIHSPSAVMRDSVGKYLALGLGEGFTLELPEVEKTVRRSVDSFTDSAAQAALSAGISGMNSGIFRPSATSETVNNYSSVTNNYGESTPIALTAQLVVGTEILAEGVVDIVADKLDQRQGLTVMMRKRGLAR